MLEDAREVSAEAELSAQIIIVGAGAAGIAIARELAGRDTPVLMLESGGLEFDSVVQADYAGESVGLRYEPLDLCRVKGFGGSTSRQGWAGWCKPMRPLDFKHRPWVPLSGWPFAREELVPHYRRALSLLSLPEDADSEAMQASHFRGALPLGEGDTENELCPLSPAPHLGEVWRDELRRSANVRVLLNATVTELLATPSGRHITGVRVSAGGDRGFTATAPIVVLAAGGIENARLLLLSDKVARPGLGNASGFVGRCFMDHPRFAWGQIRNVADPSLLLRYDPTNAATHLRDSRGTGLQAPTYATSITVSEAAQRRDQLLNARSWILPVAPGGERTGGRELREIALWLMRHRLPSDIALRTRLVLRDLPNAAAAVVAHLRSIARRSTHWQFVTILEPEPNPDSRITLADDVDRHGLRRVRLDWRLGELTERTLARTQELITADLKRAGFDCAIVGSGGEAANQRINDPRWVWHHMGTTRMSTDPAKGVVDSDCRVHGVDNLYIAGSSVFPTVGNDMPTVTLIALAYRLADHLQQGLSRSAVAGTRPIAAE